MRKSVKRAVVIGTALALTGVAGTYAVAAQAGTAPTVLARATVAGLLPGVTGSVYLEIANPNAVPIDVTTVTWLPTNAVTADGGAGSCTDTGVAFGDFSTGNTGSGGVLGGLRLTVAPGEIAHFTLRRAARMIGDSEPGCEGATFVIPVTATVRTPAV